MQHFRKNRDFAKIFKNGSRTSENQDFFRKMAIFSTMLQIVFLISPLFFYGYLFFWCYGKENVSSFQKALCLFTKYVPLGICIAFFEKSMKIAEFHSNLVLLLAIWAEVFTSALYNKIINKDCPGIASQEVPPQYDRIERWTSVLHCDCDGVGLIWILPSFF